MLQREGGLLGLGLGLGCRVDLLNLGRPSGELIP